MQGSPFYPQVTMPRSALPRVVGILAVIFAVIGLGASLLFTFGPLSDLDRGSRFWGEHGSHDSMRHWLYLWCGLSVVLFLLHLIGGALAIVYRMIGLRLLTSYAVGALVLVVVDLVVVWAVGSGHRVRSSVSVPHTVFDVVALVWPVIVVVLVNVRRARAACT